MRRLSRLGGLSKGIAFLGAVCLGGLLALLPEDKPPDEKADNGEGGDTSDDTSGNGTGVGTARAGVLGLGRVGAGVDRNTLSSGALMARLADHGTNLTVRAGGTGRGDGIAWDA